MSDRTIITINVPCEVIDEIQSGNTIYLGKKGEVRWLDGAHPVADTPKWEFSDV